MSREESIHRYRFAFRLCVFVAAVAVGAKLYVAALPQHPALGAFTVLGTGALIVSTFLDLDRVEQPIASDDSEGLG